MSLWNKLHQETTEAEKKRGADQCFIGHEFHNQDLRAKLFRALGALNLKPYFADKEVTGDYLLHKICKKIWVTRASIIDLTSANPNVYFELGVAIGLNKPVFIVLKDGETVPPLLQNFVKLRFSSYARLERDLVAQVPSWLEHSIDHHLRYNTHCHFVNALCRDRQRMTPQRQYLVLDELAQTAGRGQPTVGGDADLRAELPEALARFQYTPLFLDDIAPQDGLRFCDYCRALRDSRFALCHLHPQTTLNVYLLLGLTNGLDLPSLLLTKQTESWQLPSMLWGLDYFNYHSYTDIEQRLGDSVEAFVQRHRSQPLYGKKLFFTPPTRQPDLEPTTLAWPIIDIAQILGRSEEAVETYLDGVEGIEFAATPAISYMSSGNRKLSIYGLTEEDQAEIEFEDGAAIAILRSFDGDQKPTEAEAIQSLAQAVPTTPPTTRLGQLRYWEPFATFGGLLLHFNTDQTIVNYIHIASQAGIWAIREQLGIESVESDVKSMETRLNEITDLPLEEQTAKLKQLISELETAGDLHNLYRLLNLALHAPTDRDLIALVTALIQSFSHLYNNEGLRRALELILALDSDNSKNTLLRLLVDAYEQLGRTDKAAQISYLIHNVSKPGNMLEEAKAETLHTETSATESMDVLEAKTDIETAEETYDALTWLDELINQDPQEPTGTQDLETISSQEDELPDWLTESSKTTIETAEETDELPDWLTESSKTTIETAEETYDALTWLDELINQDPQEPTGTQDLETISSQEDELPDWLTESSKTTIETAEETDELPDWLTESSKTTIETAEETDDALTWLDELINQDPQEPTGTQDLETISSQEDELPDWLTESSRTTGKRVKGEDTFKTETKEPRANFDEEINIRRPFHLPTKVSELLQTKIEFLRQANFDEVSLSFLKDLLTDINSVLNGVSNPNSEQKLKTAMHLTHAAIYEFERDEFNKHYRSLNQLRRLLLDLD